MKGDGNNFKLALHCVEQPTARHVSYLSVDGQMLDQWNVYVCMCNVSSTIFN
jgi:hypothetical protein